MGNTMRNTKRNASSLSSLKHYCLFASGIVVSLTASAQSSVALYGRIDTSVEYANFGPSHTLHMGSSDIGATNWGIKGIEDLGGNLKAIFKLESGFNSADGTMAQSGKMFGREAWVGLSGNFGTFQLGENYTPIHTILVTYSLPAKGAGLGWGNATDNFLYGPLVRTSNSVRYVSPRVAGFLLRGLVARGNNGTSSSAPASLGDTYALGINYAKGPLQIDVGYELQRFSPVTTLTSTSPVDAGNYAAAGVSYDFGFVKPAFLYLRHRGGQNVAAQGATNYANPQSDIYELSAQIPLGIGALLVDYGHYRLVANSNGNANSAALRYDYPLSRRTIVYTGVQQVWNGSAAAFTMNTAGGVSTLTPPAKGQNSNAVIAGIVHTF